MAKKQQIELEVEKEGKLNEVIIKRTMRPNGTLRVQQDFEFCPTMAEQHTAHLTDINYLMEKYKPDELAQYIVARNQHRQEILGHDFSNEPSMQDAMNVVVESRRAFEELEPEIRNNFKNHVEFLKFIDNPANTEKLIKLGILKPKKLETLSAPLGEKVPDPSLQPQQPTVTPAKL